MMTRSINHTWTVFNFGSMLFILLVACVFAQELPAVSKAELQSDGTDTITVDTETLKGKRFEFSWKSEGGGGVNGIAVLEEDGRIRGIGSPNESTWLVDDGGRLLFKHADGRISTRYDQVEVVEGLLRFEGPFLFRAGITHCLVEIESAASSGLDHQITPDEAARIKYSQQHFVYIDPGESCTFELADGTQKRIDLISVEDHEDSVIHLTRRADVKVAIDGVPITLTCAPYVMPVEEQGLRIQADTTSAWLDIPKRVQLSLWDVSDPIVDTSLFCFPLPGYRLFSHGMQAYNEPVHLGYRDGDPAGNRFYHNYGVDLAGYEGRQKVLSCIDGVVVYVGSQQGDLAIRDDVGLVVHFGHLDAILSNVRVGEPVERGQWVAMLGRRGPSGNFSHLHVGVFSSEHALNANRSNRALNLYPWLFAAYQQENRTDLYAMARPHKTVLTGERVLFDGTSSTALTSKITSFRWEFHDTTTADGARAEKVYDKPGCYMAALWIRDSRGREDVDFCKVKVYSRSAPEDVVPTLFVTYTPSKDLRVGQPVSFRIWPQGLDVEGINVEFGDGTVCRDYRPYSAISHTFQSAGIHIVTVAGTAAGMPVAQKAKVIVRE